jgi:hypothetical protein
MDEYVAREIRPGQAGAAGVRDLLDELVVRDFALGLVTATCRASRN